MLRRRHKMRLHFAGFALLEALVALLILSTGILGTVGLQLAMTQAQGSAKSRGDAALLASELSGMMWANTSDTRNANLVSYTSACPSDSCRRWHAKVARVLPQGKALVATDAHTGTITIALSWTSPTDGAHTYVTSTSVR